MQFKVSFFQICAVVCYLYACRCILWESLNGCNGELQHTLFTFRWVWECRSNHSSSNWRRWIFRETIAPAFIASIELCFHGNKLQRKDWRNYFLCFYSRHMINWLLCEHSRRSCWTQISSTLWMFCRSTNKLSCLLSISVHSSHPCAKELNCRYLTGKEWRMLCPLNRGLFV